MMNGQTTDKEVFPSQESMDLEEKIEETEDVPMEGDGEEVTEESGVAEEETSDSDMPEHTEDSMKLEEFKGCVFSDTST